VIKSLKEKILNNLLDKTIEKNKDKVVIQKEHIGSAITENATYLEIS